MSLFDMRREAPRTLLSLSSRYQAVPEELYEVLVVDNGSAHPMTCAEVEAFGSNFRYSYHETDSKSPVVAINTTAARARGDWLALCIDGARILSPGVLSRTLELMALKPSLPVATLGFHLGSEPQSISAPKGYNQQVEDDLLNASQWQADGYRLFDISCLSDSSREGWFGPFSESNFLAMPRDTFWKLGGFEPQFESAGGGLANLDLFRRLIAASNRRIAVLLGEGTFHQVHGGVASNAAPEQHPWQRFADEYQRIRGETYQVPEVEPVFYGALDPRARRFLEPRNAPSEA